LAGAKQAAEKGLKTAQPEENPPSGPKGRAHFKRLKRHPSTSLRAGSKTEAVTFQNILKQAFFRSL